MDNLYKHIEELGKNHGYKNITAFCSAAGVPRSTMTELNKGRSADLSKPNAQKFADCIHVSLDEIYGIEQKEKPDLSEEEAELNEYLEELKNRKEMRMLFKLAKGATKKDVEKAVQIVEAYLKENETE